MMRKECDNTRQRQRERSEGEGRERSAAARQTRGNTPSGGRLSCEHKRDCHLRARAPVFPAFHSYTRCPPDGISIRRLVWADTTSRENSERVFRFRRLAVDRPARVAPFDRRRNSKLLRSLRGSRGSREDAREAGCHSSVNSRAHPVYM